MRLLAFVHSPLVLFARSRGLLMAAPLAVLVAAWCLKAYIEIVQNPLLETAGALLIALGGLGAGVFCSMMFDTSMAHLEAVVPARRLRALRLGWLVALVVIVGVAGTVALLVRGVNGWYVVMHWRNTLQGVGLACLSACLLPRAAAWTVPATALALCWLLGIKDLAGTPRLLAFPCYLPNSGLAWAVTAALFAVAAGVYAWRDAWKGA